MSLSVDVVQRRLGPVRDGQQVVRSGRQPGPVWTTRRDCVQCSQILKGTATKSVLASGQCIPNCCVEFRILEPCVTRSNYKSFQGQPKTVDLQAGENRRGRDRRVQAEEGV